jgi:hypothetical protein
MKLVKSLLLGSAAALVAGAGAQAADLPARKAAPVEYVKVCDAYGAGFFFIPGTDTCIKVGGRVRADFAMSNQGDVYNVAGITPAGVRFNGVSNAAGSQNIYGWEARGRVDLDARTQTPYGTVQAVASLRLARTTGILDNAGLSAGALASATIGPAPNANNASSTLEAAYIRFAGFTFGAARDNFSFMPSTFYGAGHWASFANGAKQIAYTAVLGGGFSATIAMQDAADTTLGGSNGSGFFNAFGVFVPTGAAANAVFAFRSMPQLNGRLDLDQGWGSASLMGAVGRASGNTLTGTNTAVINGAPIGTADLNADKTVWAIGAGVKVNLPMIAAGDVLWLNAAYADGMTEYTVNWTYFKGSDTRRNTTGFVNNAPSWINTIDSVGNARIETVKSWNLAAVYTHYWTPEWRHSFLATGGRIEGSSIQNANVFGTGGAFGDATVWNVGTQLAWLPTRNFEIGVDVLYNRVNQDVRRSVGTISGNTFTPTAGAGSVVTRESSNGVTGRLRVERTF